MGIKNKVGNTNEVGGHFLCSGNLSNFKATGELGQSVYQIAVSLRDTIRRHNKSAIPLERFFAIPYENPQSNSVDWYADANIPTHSDQRTTIINWNQADAEEQEIAKEKIFQFKDQIKALSESLSQKQKDTTSDLYVFSQLLPKTLIIPTQYGEIKDGKNIIDPSYIFLVGSEQQPVLAFWGFSHPNAPITAEPFHFLSNPLPPAPVNTTAAIPSAPLASTNSTVPPLAATNTPPPLAPVPVPQRNNWWSWLRWLLLLSLLLFLLFFVWRSCSKPAVPTLPTMTPPSISLADNTTNTSPSANRLWDVNLPNISWPNWLPSLGIKDGVGVGAGAETDLAAMSTPNLADLAQQTPELNQGENAIQSTINADANANANGLEPTALPQPTLPTLGPELQIPPQLAGQAMPSYINGQWQVHGIQDQKTGRPVRLEYDINDGKGAVRIHKSDGVDCNGSIQAAGQQSGLQINSTSQAACADGSTYDMPEIECSLNARQETECVGRYGNQKFPISMRHATE